MAYGYPIADPTAWATTLAQYHTARAAYTSLPDGSDRSTIDGAFDNVIKAEAAVLDLHSPDLSAVIEKLRILWDEKLGADKPESDHRRMVIGDLSRISFLQS